MLTHRVMRKHRRYKITWNQGGALVYQLIKGMLAVSAWLSPDNRARGPSYLLPVAIHMLAIALHITLLKIRRKTMHVLIVRKYGFRLNPEEINVPQADERHQYRNILFKCS